MVTTIGRILATGIIVALGFGVFAKSAPFAILQMFMVCVGWAPRILEMSSRRFSGLRRPHPRPGTLSPLFAASAGFFFSWPPAHLLRVTCAFGKHFVARPGAQPDGQIRGFNLIRL